MSTPTLTQTCRTAPQQMVDLLEVAAKRSCPAWCDHAICEPMTDLGDVTRLHTRNFWASDDHDRQIVWNRTDAHTLDGVIEGAGELWADLPYCGEEDGYRQGLAEAFRFVYDLGRGTRD